MVAPVFALKYLRLRSGGFQSNRFKIYCYIIHLIFSVTINDEICQYCESSLVFALNQMRLRNNEAVFNDLFKF